MTNLELARTLEAVAVQMQVVAGLATELRRSVGLDGQRLVELEGSMDRVVRLLRGVQPKTRDEA